ncbi:hypothetical protein H9L05_05820 [Hymenobacter qilianensis]|uniref:Uncharacterized protein n=1 Tax=Hymenobacter qilianensis TaxID=1385715 RepID=A0A7H0GY01_9BACT|nr:hypothetical protein [Hymenobacter qilianensis]QNP53167.1 hypothetical protein H9L05_05820 [Hymenobacter qilianensis]
MLLFSRLRLVGASAEHLATAIQALLATALRRSNLFGLFHAAKKPPAFTAVGNAPISNVFTYLL